MNWIKNNKKKSIAICIGLFIIICFAAANHCNHNNISVVVDRYNTCKNYGKVHIICDDCGKWVDSDGNTVKEGTYGTFNELGEHNYGEWETIEEATCVTEGIKVHSCTACGYEERETIAKTNHTPGDTIINGNKLETKCSVCGEVYKSEEINETYAFYYKMLNGNDLYEGRMNKQDFYVSINDNGTISFVTDYEDGINVRVVLTISKSEGIIKASLYDYVAKQGYEANIIQDMNDAAESDIDLKGNIGDEFVAVYCFISMTTIACAEHPAL